LGGLVLAVVGAGILLDLASEDLGHRIAVSARRL
jgi:hypothetical protein